MRLVKSVIRCVIATSAVTALASCNYSGDEMVTKDFEIHQTYWYIVNDTDEKLYFRVSEDEAITPIVLYPETSYPVYYLESSNEELFDFSMMEANLKGTSLNIFVEGNDTPVKTWDVKEKNDSGKQFFNEAYWELQFKSIGQEKIYTFHIEPSDIE